jgi:hypothetical protein
VSSRKAADADHGPVQEMLVAGQFYPAAAARLAALRALFPRTPVSFALAIGDPVRLLARALEDDPEAGVLPAPASESAASALRWSLPLTRLRAQCPDVEITLWDVEDLPGVQDEVLIALVGPAAAALADAAAVILSGGLSRQGESVLAGYLAARPPHDRAGVERIAAIFRKHFRAGDDPPDPAVPPGWEASIATEIGALYREDRARIAAIDGVRLLRGTPTA